MKKYILKIMIGLVILGSTAIASDEWIMGQPVQTDITNYEWILGTPYVVTEAEEAAETTIPIFMNLYRQRRN